MSVTTKEITPAFNSEVTKTEGGQYLNRCFSCGACSGICPVSQAITEFDPRKIIHMVRMGLKDRLLKSDLLWFCSQCKSCVFVCPQDVRFAEIVEALWEIAYEQEYITDQDILDKGKAAWVERDKCVSCLTCVRVCPWEIPKIDTEGFATIDIRDCKACGICVAECPAQAIMLNQSQDEELIAACGSK
jgi:heterodisulfide reductase subunit C